MDGIIGAVLSARTKSAIKSSSSSTTSESEESKKLRVKSHVHEYYWKAAARDPRPLIHACVILNRYGGEMHTDKLLSKLRSRQYFPFLQLAEELGLIERKQQKILRKWHWKGLLGELASGPLILLAEESKPEVQNAIKQHKEKWNVWTEVYVVVNKLTPKGRELAKKAIDTSALQVTGTRRYRP